MSRCVDLTGRRFGNWNVLYRDMTTIGSNARWMCRCDCGVEKSVRSNHLISGNTKSCGCLRERDLTGMKFNSWKVLKKISKQYPQEWHGNKYLCICDCGTERELLGGSLTTGASKTCGCSQIKETKDTALQSLFNGTKNNAKRRKIDFSLSKEYFAILSEKPCSYCGSLPEQRFNVKKTKMSTQQRKFFYNGIDRVDSSEGYTETNTVSCCKNCNFSKHSMSLDEWKAHIKKICKHLEIL